MAILALFDIFGRLWIVKNQSAAIRPRFFDKNDVFRPLKGSKHVLQEVIPGSLEGSRKPHLPHFECSFARKVGKVWFPFLVPIARNKRAIGCQKEGRPFEAVPTISSGPKRVAKQRKHYKTCKNCKKVEDEGLGALRAST